MPGNAKSILAVDDAYINLEIVHGLLRNRFDIHLAKSGNAALTALARFTPDIILLDIEMPDISGFNVMESISRNDRLKKIPVIFVTAHASKDYVIQARRQGATDYLVKPFEPDLLYAKIADVINDVNYIYKGAATAYSPDVSDDIYDLEHDMRNLCQSTKKKASGIHIKIIGDLLGYADAESEKSDIVPTYFDLKDFFSGIESVYRPKAIDKGLTFDSVFDAGLPRIIFGDETRLNLVISSILGNVIQYSAKGYVRFNVELITAEDETERVIFNIEGSELREFDNDFAKIFAKFEQILKEKPMITSPKLPIAKRLAELSGGGIYFINTRNKNAAFTVELPFQEERGGQNRREEPPRQVKVKPEAKILVVDDNPVNLKIAAAMLSKHGVAAEKARNSEEAIKMVQEKQFDLIFMDHLMPDMDGAETAKVIRSLEGEYYSEVPIIALSAYNAAKARELFIKSGMNDFIAKPIDGAELNMALKNWLPPDKVIVDRPDKQDAEANDAEVNELLNRVSIAVSQELSIVKGLKVAGGDKKLYIEVLAHFCDWIQNDMRLINEAIQHKRWKDFTIRIHALKTVFANIGDTLMSDWAASLEQAAFEGNYEKCVKETEYFYNNVMKLYSKLSKIFIQLPKKTRASGNTIPADTVDTILGKLSEACLTCFADRAAELSSELKGAGLGEELDGDISRMCDYIDSYDFDKAYNISQALLESLTLTV